MQKLLYKKNLKMFTRIIDNFVLYVVVIFSPTFVHDI